MLWSNKILSLSLSLGFIFNTTQSAWVIVVHSFEIIFDLWHPCSGFEQDTGLLSCKLYQVFLPLSCPPYLESVDQISYFGFVFAFIFHFDFNVYLCPLVYFLFYLCPFPPYVCWCNVHFLCCFWVLISLTVIYFSFHCLTIIKSFQQLIYTWSRSSFSCQLISAESLYIIQVR